PAYACTAGRRSRTPRARTSLCEAIRAWAASEAKGRPRYGAGACGTPNSRSWVATSWQVMHEATRPAEVTAPAADTVAYTQPSSVSGAGATLNMMNRPAGAPARKTPASLFAYG